MEFSKIIHKNYYTCDCTQKSQKKRLYNIYFFLNINSEETIIYLDELNKIKFKTRILF